MKKIKIIAILAIIAFIVIINAMIGIVGEQKKQVLMSEEIPGSGGYCFVGYTGDDGMPIISVDISPCHSEEIIHYSISAAEPLPSGTVRGYILRRGIMSVMPNGAGITFEEGIAGEGRAIFSVQSV